MPPDDDWFFGTDPDFLHRADSPWTSVLAAHSVDSAGKERLVYNAICEYGPHGCIADDLRRDYPLLPYSTITARPCSLDRKGLIVRGPDARIGKSGSMQLVMRKSKYADYILRPEKEKKPRTGKKKRGTTP